MNILWIIKKLIALLFALYIGLGILIVFGDDTKFMRNIVNIVFSISLIILFLTAILIYKY